MKVKVLQDNGTEQYVDFSIVRGYKLLSGFISQSGEDAPIIEEITNEIGEYQTAFTQQGTFRVTTDGLFTEGTYSPQDQSRYMDRGSDFLRALYAFRLNDNEFQIQTNNESDGAFPENGSLYRYYFEIRVPNA